MGERKKVAYIIDRAGKGGVGVSVSRWEGGHKEKKSLVGGSVTFASIGYVARGSVGGEGPSPARPKNGPMSVFEEVGVLLGVGVLAGGGGGGGVFDAKTAAAAAEAAAAARVCSLERRST